VAVFAGTSGNFGQLPARAANAFARRALADSSFTANPSAVLTSFTVLELRRNAFGSLSAWELPDLKTFAVAVVIGIYRAYRFTPVKSVVQVAGMSRLREGSAGHRLASHRMLKNTW